MRKKYLFLFIIFLLPVFSINAEEIKLTGIYKGDNIYVENPYSPSGVGYCVHEVIVNGFTTTDEVNSSFFEIDLSIYNFKFGDEVVIIIKHKEGCKPKIINKEVLIPFSTCVISSITIDDAGYLRWSTTNEHGSLPFIIEQYRWNKWIRIGVVQGTGKNKLNRYFYKVDFHSGKNKFRIKQTGAAKKAKYSKSIEHISNVPENHFIPGNGGKTSDIIVFSIITRYEIFDYYGKLVLKGTARDLNVKKLKPGTYFINYDNKTETFTKK